MYLLDGHSSQATNAATSSASPTLLICLGAGFRSPVGAAAAAAAAAVCIGVSIDPLITTRVSTGVYEPHRYFDLRCDAIDPDVPVANLSD
jgi:hypothetical protein